MERKFWGLTVADVMCLAYQLAVTNGTKNLFFTRNEKTGRKWLKNFLLTIRKFQWQPLKFFTLKCGGFHSWISSSLFLNLRTRCVHNSTQSCKTLQLRRSRRHYCTAQTHEHIRIERQASDIFCSVRRKGISRDSRQPVKPELINDTPPGSINACQFSGWIQSEIFTHWFLHFIKRTKSTKKILLSRYRTGTVHTQGTWRSLL